MAPDFHAASSAFPPSPESGDGHGSTSLKWGSNGELSPVDLQRVLERLTDPSLTRCRLDGVD
ncbi:MAG: hypothetical protein RLZZ219_398 [Cyanobacteriota bacterium]|jgi:hypothetical protein